MRTLALGGVSARVLLASAGLAMAVPAALAQPVNDDCGSARAVTMNTNGTTTVTGTTNLATQDGTANCEVTGPDVWFRVTCPAVGALTVDTCGGANNFDTVVSFHTACGPTGTQLACNDDGVGCAAGRSRLTLGGMTAGRVVYVRLSGLQNTTGNYSAIFRHTTAQPPNPTLGPDVTIFNVSDVTRWGTSGDITAYSVGTDSCNRGDYPLMWIDNGNYNPDFDTTRHPVISQNMYRLKNYTASGVTYQRFEQLGQSWLKHGFVSTNSQQAGCGNCQGSPQLWRPSTVSYQSVGGDALGINCTDLYSSSLNGSQSSQGAKNIVNPTLGTSPFIRNNGTGNATIRQRLQVPTADVTSQPAGTRFFVDANYVASDDSQFVRPGQIVAFNATNNSSWRELTAASINNSSPTFVAATRQQDPGIFAWRQVDAGVTLVAADHDDTPIPGSPGKYIRSRYWAAAKVTNLNNGSWRYEYAIYNLNSDRGAQKLVFRLADDAPVTEFTFRAPQWHSGEPYSNTPWTMTKDSNTLIFSGQTFESNVNGNAIRWCTMFNFGFTTTVPPTVGQAKLALFKPPAPGTGQTEVLINDLPIPTPPCVADFNGDGETNPDDLASYIACYFSSTPCEQAEMSGDTTIDADDLSNYIASYFAGC